MCVTDYTRWQTCTKEQFCVQEVIESAMSLKKLLTVSKDKLK
jgi:hypothetical protein